MPTRDERRAEAAKHLATMRTVFATETAASIKSTKIYEDGEGRELEIPEPAFEKTAVKVVYEQPAQAAHAAKGTCIVVDSASFTRPGGGYEEGAFPAEAALCAESNLFDILQGIKDEYHERNREYLRGSLFTDRAFFIEDVKFSGNGAIKNVGVVGAAAPNRKRALENHRDAKECDADLARRIETVMRIAAVHGCNTLVLGSFGCGALGNDATQVAELYKAWIDAHPGVFENVVVAVPFRTEIDAFRDVLDKPVEKPVVVETDEEDEEEELAGIELPEGVTLRA